MGPHKSAFICSNTDVTGVVLISENDFFLLLPILHDIHVCGLNVLANDIFISKPIVHLFLIISPKPSLDRCPKR